MKTRVFSTAQAKGKASIAPAAVAGFTQRRCGCGQHVTGVPQCPECAKKSPRLHRKKANEARFDEQFFDAHEVLAQSQGQALDGHARGYMEARFQHDFSQVRVHTGATAAATAQAVNALAFTFGRDIVFGADQYAPRTARGIALLAHELTHVVQQAGGVTAARSAKVLSEPNDAAEREADAVAQQIMAPSSRKPVTVKCSPDAAIHALDTGTGVALGIGGGLLGGLAIAGLAGAFDKNEFTDAELTAYLNTLDSGKIEGHTESDNKARALVRRVLSGKSNFLLSAVQKSLLVREMQDGYVSADDREGILSLLENSSDADLLTVLGPSVNLAALFDDLNAGSFADRLVMLFVRRPALHGDPALPRFATWYAKENFDADQQAMAQKVLRDVLAVATLDFTDAAEFKNEIFKRLRISAMMQESQASSNGFDYPESVRADSGCSDYQPPQGNYKINLANARVNKAARDYWNDVVLDQQLIYYFDLTSKGRDNAYDALTKLFTPQSSICDKTLIHCDYLVNVIQFRAYAESIGTDKFDSFVKSGRIQMRLTYSGFPQPWPQPADSRSPKALGYSQNTRPNSRSDFIIGDHVIFWNHLAFDGLNVMQQSPWRLENAVLVDKDDSGEDLFQGHGSGPAIREHGMLKELVSAAGGYNYLARPALAMTRDIDAGQPRQAELQREYPQVTKQAGRWIVTDPGSQRERQGNIYGLKLADETNPESDPLLPGLKDPLNPNQLGQVDRPIESAAGRPAQP